ncbi:HlyD family secretion protein [Marinicellulosiphila megalodicopiae]|uniref:HlyD family secretion protein n=1 Tax=Marinicellulosiphila megalodicopiae TaxID=2724896 RepID=UPI003BB18CC4
MFGKKTLISLSIICVTLVLIILMVMQKEDVSKIENKNQAKYVTTVIAKKGNWSPMHSVIGKIDTDSLNEIQSQVSAKVKSLLVYPGQTVEKGQVLIELDPLNAQRELQRLNAQLQDMTAQIEIQKRQHKLDRSLLEFDKEQFKKAQDNYTREKTLLAKQLISNSQFEQIVTQLNQAERTVLQRKLAVESQQAQQMQLMSNLNQLNISIDAQNEQIQLHTITASFDGVIGALNLKVGQSVIVGQNLLVLFNDQSRLFKVSVASKLAQQIESKLMINNQQYSILTVDPIINFEQAGQEVVFDISGQALALNSHQYGYWVSPVVENSFLLEPKALFEYERVYYLKEVQKDFVLEEAKVILHGIHILDEKEYWVATSDSLPEEPLLLTSKLSNLYSGIEVTNKLPEPKDSNNDELISQDISSNAGNSTDVETDAGE